MTSHFMAFMCLTASGVKGVPASTIALKQRVPSAQIASINVEDIPKVTMTVMALPQVSPPELAEPATPSTTVQSASHQSSPQVAAVSCRQ